MRNLIAILFVFITLKAGAQRSYNWMNSEADWKRLKLEETISVANTSEIDTAIIVASNRMMQKDSLRFMNEDLQKDYLHYFFVYVHNGTWHVLPAKTLYEAMQFLPDKNKDWVVYTEGMGKVFTADLDRGIRLSAFYNVNVVLLDYPSIHTTKGSLANYSFAMNNARDAHKDFAPVIDTIQTLRKAKLMGTGSMSLFFHSMGNNVMSEIVIQDKLKSINDEVWVDNLVLNAPCVKQKKHHKWVNPVNFARNIYIHYNPEDKTLYFAQIAAFGGILGKKVKPPLSAKAIYINFNTAVGEGHSNFLPRRHSRSFSPAVFAHYNTLFHGGTITPGDNNSYVPTAYKNIGWDLLPEKAQNTTKNQP